MKRFTTPFTETVRLFLVKREAVEFAKSQSLLQNSIILFPYADKSDGDSDFQRELNKFHLILHISLDI